MNITIPINRNRFPIVFIISLLLTIVLGINLVYTKTDNMYRNGLVNWIFNGAFLLIPFVLMMVSLADWIKTRFDKKVMLTISEAGLYDNLSIFSCGKILWSDISSAEVVKAFKTDFLIIKVIDTDKYLADKNFVQRFILKKYIKAWNTPVVLSEKRINYNLNELKQIILKHLAE